MGNNLHKRTFSQMQQDSTQSNNNSNEPNQKKQKTSNNNNEMEIDTTNNTTTNTMELESLNDINETKESANNENDRPSLVNRQSYPMPSPRPRRKSSLRQFDPSEFKDSRSQSMDNDDDTNITDFEASISALPPLVAQKDNCNYNKMEVYGWGCSDPLLYNSQIQNINNNGNGNENENGIKDEENSMDIDDHEDEIIPSRCLVGENTMKFNFNDLSANFNGAILWQRDCNGLYGWGDNEDGAVGDGIGFQINNPRDMHKFNDRPVRFVSVGEKHTGVILQYGGLYVFGCNENGQCGVDQKYLRIKADAVVPGLGQAGLCQVACGASMTLALTKHGTLYSFGNKDVDGLLGRNNFVRWPSFQANVIPSVYYNSVIEIVVGERHCLLRTRYNRIFGWGKNNHGQLGVGDTETRSKPTEIVPLTQKEMIQIECGGSHTTVLMKNGAVYCFGNNNYGQCGINPATKKQLLKPEQVEGKWDENSITQIGCGRYHTLCTDSEKVWAFGQNSQGQCTGDVNDGIKLWTPHEVVLNLKDNRRRLIRRICGTSFSSLILTKIVSKDYISKIQTLYKLQPMDYPCSIDFTQLDVLCTQIESEENDITYLSSLLTTVFGSPSCLNQSFMTSVNCYKHQYGTGIDFKLMHKIYNRIIDISPLLTNRLVKSLLTLARRSLKYIQDAQEATNLRFYFLILSYPDIINPGFNHFITQQLNELIRRIRSSKPKIFENLIEWVSSWSLETRSNLLHKLQECMSMYLEIKNKPDHYIAFICDPLKIIYEANQLIINIEHRIPYDKFYNRTLTRGGYLDFKADYEQFTNSNKFSFSFCDYPFLLDPVAKRNILLIEKDKIKMAYARPTAQQMFQGGMNMMQMGRPFIFNPFFVLAVRRRYVLQDTLQWLVRTAQNEPDNFFKELKIVFDKEEGVDQGGVRKEFFQLIIRECFDIKYGTFVYNENTRCYWFNQNALEQPQEYMLLGIIIGLAIYNGVLLDIHFPPVVYNKMCGEPVSIKDLQGYDPMIYKSVQQIMEYKSNVEDLCLSFSVDYMKWDKLETHNLKENGVNIPVTNDNKNEYIELLTNYYLNDSIKTQFDAFLKGLKLVLKGKAFDMITNGDELELLICGNRNLDFDALEVSCKYEGGYNNEHKVIRWFWQILHEFNENEKKQFLKFFSGSDRAPLRGLGKLGMLVQKATGDNYNGDQLPTAHTCFNALLLPAYVSKELMKRKLLAAIQYSEGFGLK